MQTKIAFYEKTLDKFLVYQTKENKSDLGLYLVPVVHIKNKSIPALRGLLSRHLLGENAPNFRIISANPNWDNDSDKAILQIQYDICKESEVNNFNPSWRPIREFFENARPNELTTP